MVNDRHFNGHLRRICMTIIYLHFDFERLHFGCRPIVDHNCGQKTSERKRNEHAQRVRQHRITSRK
jgi:hypothetical protein